MLRDDDHQHFLMEPFCNFNHLSEEIHRLESERNSISSQIDVLEYQRDTINDYEQTRQHRRSKAKYRKPTPDKLYLHEQQSVFNSSKFINEINHFKLRLNTLEKERYELEEKVRRLQEENTTYKNRFTNGNSDWIAARPALTLNGRTTPSSIAENDIERLKRRIESLVKSNDEKERKIEDLQIQISKCQTPIPSSNGIRSPILNTNGNNNIQKFSYEADGNISDSNSIPSFSSDKDSQKPLSTYNGHDSIINSHHNPLIKLKLDVLQRASSAEPMLTREFTSTPIHDQSVIKRVLPNPKYDQSGYISDGPSQKYSIYKKSLSTNLDKYKSSSAKGLKHMFGKIIRTNSGNIREDKELQITNSVQRGGSRATMNGGKHHNKQLSAIETTFSRWQTEQIVNWLYGIGLGQYANECRKHFKNGLQLLHATPEELEKKIGMRNPLHRKKLYLCLNGLCTQQTEANSLDTHWVQKWLDDIGLPQYKEYFSESKVDGRILNNLTLEDIIYLNITNELHHLSIKRSIQVLRLTGFKSECIKRRPSPEDKNDMAEVMHWSNHRVMEWLRSIDLSEYAPNLRGSGVCGALIVFELRFNATTLAEILSIPLSKTLLRRHLLMRFQELIGNDLQNRKNQYEKSPNCQPLTPQTKIKFSRGLFAHRRARSVDADDLICPMNENEISNGISPTLKRFQRKELPLVDTLEDELVLAHDSPTTVV